MPEDIDIAEDIFGKDVPALNGKSTCSKPPSVRQDIVEIPSELLEKHQDLELCIDTMHINGVPFLTSINRSIKYRSVVPLKGKSHDNYYAAIDDILRCYNKADFQMTAIHCDPEFAELLKPLEDDQGIHLIATNTDDHVPEAERNIWMLKEHIRASFYVLPYKKIPKLMIQYMATRVADQLNYFPVKGGVSSYYSPRMILKRSNLDFVKHCKVPFGAYVQACNEPKPYNSNKPRTIGAIYLQPLDVPQGGHELMDLQSGRRITRRHVTKIPVTEHVIATVEARASKEGFTTLKFTTKQGKQIPDADWIAGVDYQDNTDSDSDEEYEEDRDSDTDSNSDEEEEENQIDQGKLDDITREPADTNPTNIPEQQQEPAEAEPANIEQPVAVSNNEDPAEASEPESMMSPHHTRSGRSFMSTDKKVTFAAPIPKKLEHCHNLITQVSPNPDEDVEYHTSLANVIARTMVYINHMVREKGASFAQQYILQKGLKIFGKRGHDAAIKEMDQLHRQHCFTPCSIKEMTPEEHRKAMEALLLLTEKRNKTVKGRMVYNGKPSREWIGKEDSASPTAALESILITAVIDAKER